MRYGILLAIAGALLAGDGKKNGHPHFDDKSTLAWHTELKKAQAAARKENKVVFIEFGREL